MLNIEEVVTLSPFSFDETDIRNTNNAKKSECV